MSLIGLLISEKMFENVDGQTMDIGVTGILLAFGSGELIKAAVCGSSMIMYMLVSSAKNVLMIECYLQYH